MGGWAGCSNAGCQRSELSRGEARAAMKAAGGAGSRRKQAGDRRQAGGGAAHMLVSGAAAPLRVEVALRPVNRKASVVNWCWRCCYYNRVTQ
jgi:hypothetical protein